MSETYVFSTAAVAAPHPSIAETGQTILAAGGNAVEATIAMAATAAVACPHLNGLGGDGFWMVREQRGRVHALDAGGGAGKLATIGRYRDKGHDRLPLRGPDAAVTVAGAVAGWRLGLELAKALGGQLPLDLLMGDAIRLAREGYAVSAADSRALSAEAGFDAPGFAAAFLTADGKAPAAGSLRRMPRLADTLEQLAHAGLGDFYRGDVGREIAADLERIGSPVRRGDLETCRARVVQPLSLRLGFGTVHHLPPPGQGVAALLALGIAGRLKLRRGETAENHHGLVEAIKRAYAIRDRVVTDPLDLDIDPASLLEPAALEREAAGIDARRASPFRTTLPPHGAPAWMGCVDRDGLAVSYTQSVGPAFGSGCVLPATGIHWQARGPGFSLDPSGRNPLEPGRRPLQAAAPGLAVFDDGRVLIYGGGGSEEPQVGAQVLTRYAAAGIGLADALEAPRWILASGDGPEPVLTLEEGFDPSLAAELSRRGHRIEEAGRDRIDLFGHAGVVVKHPRDGRTEAMYDPRSDGAVLGL